VSTFSELALRPSIRLAFVFCLCAAAASAAEPRLIEAVKAADRDAVRVLLRDHGTAVEAADPDGTTALHWAVRNDDRVIVDLLLRAGAQVNASNRYGVTPLALAALNGNVGIVTALLNAGANPNARLAENQTALMAAARAGRSEVVKVLLAHGADANAREVVLGETAAMWAALENHADTIGVLAAYGADLNARSTMTTFPRFKFGDGIVARQTSLPRGGWTPLMYAARQGAIDAARALANAGADLNLSDPNGTSALVEAIINAHFDLSGMLAERGARPDVAEVTGMGALYAAVDMHTLAETVGRPNPKPHDTLDSPALVELLLAHGANPNAQLNSPILDRVHNDGNSDPALGEGATPLMRAARQTDVAMMRILLDRGANVNQTARNGKTALMFAADRTSGARSADGEREALDAVALCLERGASVNAADDTGQTALHAAAGSASERVISLLAAKGADLFRKDHQGRTPLDVAQSGGGRGGGRNARFVAGADGQGATTQSRDRELRIALLRRLMGLSQ
jgi:ankyrin repeat protein